ncbi:hypothetical protein B0O99DRAFT_688298 [Bisporella sp. PMI_857]|nr:hypothetical protein B0O99DRAFT_688298 [Bisporella sp. PMI_857]
MPLLDDFQGLGLWNMVPFLACTSLAWLIVYRLFLHPLAGVPGPLLAKISRLWLLRNDFSWKGSENFHRMHQKYGPVVRIAPNELSYDDLATYNDIYGQKSRFLKEEAWHYGIVPKFLTNMFIGLAGSAKCFRAKCWPGILISNYCINSGHNS